MNDEKELELIKQGLLSRKDFIERKQEDKIIDKVSRMIYFLLIAKRKIKTKDYYEAENIINDVIDNLERRDFC